MVVLARACGHDSLSHFTPRDLTSWKREVADLVGVVLRRGVPMTWHRIDGGARRGPRTHRGGRRAHGGGEHLRRPGRRAGEPLSPPGRAAGRGVDRGRAAALPVARLRLRPGDRRAPRRASPTPPTGLSTSSSDRTASGSTFPTSPSGHAASPTSWSRPSSRGASTPSSAWSATPTSGSPRPCAGPRNAASCATSASDTKVRRRSPPRAYGKLTGRPAACFAIAGPGSTNLLTGLYDARLDGAPVVAISGQVPSKVLGRGAFQDVDLSAVFRDVALSTVTVHAGSPTTPSWPALAVKHATDGRGVAHLVLPDEVQDAAVRRPGRRPRPVDVPTSAVAPSPATLDAAARPAAWRDPAPVLVVGHGAARCGRGGARPGRAARRAGAHHVPGQGPAAGHPPARRQACSAAPARRSPRG